MHRDRREAELLFTTMYAGVPLYAAESGSTLAVVICHVALGLLLLRALFRADSALQIPPALLKASAAAYLVFLPFDAAMLSGSLIAASTHLVFFIAVYQALDAESRTNAGQRLLIALLIFVISLATSTSLSIVLFVIGFALLTYRQLIDWTHTAALNDAQHEFVADPPKRAALTYLMPTALVAAALFPLLPRVHNPLVRGISGSLEGSSTGLSDSIDFSVARSISADPTVVARVWMPQDAVPFFAPLRLRGSVYDAWIDKRWKTSSPGYPRRVPSDARGFAVARPGAFTRTVTVQQSVVRQQRVYLPVGTHHVRGISQLTEMGRRSIYVIPSPVSHGVLSYQAELSRTTLPLDPVAPHMPEYPITPRVASFAQKIVGDARTPAAQAGRIEDFLSSKFTYVPDPASIGRAITVDEFLLRERRGHCEYFAAGMVVVLEALGVPSRIVGGFYGGQLNPLTGYFTVKKSDAHAWVEVWDGERWLTYDPTPASLRPGNQKRGLVRAYASAIADSVNYFWDRYILTFGLADQVALAMRAIEGLQSAARGFRSHLAVWRGRLLAPPMLLAIFLIATTILALQRAMRWRRPHFVRAVEALQRVGFPLTDATTADELLKVVARQRPDLETPLRAVIEAYQQERFSQHELAQEARREARIAFKELMARI